jgi:hypothetical protein
MFGRHKIDPEAVGDSVAELLARERPEYNQAAVTRQQEHLAKAAFEAGLSEDETLRALQALMEGYQERTTKKS